MGVWRLAFGADVGVDVTFDFHALTMQWQARQGAVLSVWRSSQFDNLLFELLTYVPKIQYGVRLLRNRKADYMPLTYIITCASWISLRGRTKASNWARPGRCHASSETRLITVSIVLCGIPIR